MLTLAEQLLLLSLHDEKGSVLASASTALPYGLAGATILDLYFEERITFNNTQVHVVDQMPTGNELLDEVLALLSHTTNTHDIKYWIRRMRRKVNDLTDRVAERLVAQHILAQEEHQFLWVINYQRYPTQDSLPEAALRDTLRAIIVDDQPPTESETALLSLIKACNLFREIFPREERKIAAQKITTIIEDEAVGKAVSATVREVTGAVMAAITASMAAAASSQ